MGFVHFIAALFLVIVAPASTWQCAPEVWSAYPSCAQGVIKNILSRSCNNATGTIMIDGYFCKNNTLLREVAHQVLEACGWNDLVSIADVAFEECQKISTPIILNKEEFIHFANGAGSMANSTKRMSVTKVVTFTTIIRVSILNSTASSLTTSKVTPASVHEIHSWTIFTKSSRAPASTADEVNVTISYPGSNPTTLTVSALNSSAAALPTSIGMDSLTSLVNHTMTMPDTTMSGVTDAGQTTTISTSSKTGNDTCCCCPSRSCLIVCGWDPEVDRQLAKWNIACACVIGLISWVITWMARPAARGPQ